MTPLIPFDSTSESSLRHSARTEQGPRRILRSLWRHRALLAGLAAFSLALMGEWLMRTQAQEPAINAELGARLVQIAVLLVGIVAWVRDSGWRVRTFSTPGNDAGQPLEPSLPVRRANTRPASQIDERDASDRVLTSNAGPRAATLPTTFQRYSSLRMRIGWRGTLAGLLITGGFGVWLGLLLRENFAHPMAPWVWLAMLCALALTFVGVKPWPKGESLLPHDPDEPVREPLVGRIEWLLVGAIMLISVAVRFWDLENIPAGPYIDESGRAIDARHLNNGEPVNQRPFVFFGTGWWGVPSFYFWLVAQSMKLFGDDLHGARVVHALAGVLAVWFTYRLARVIWSPRAGVMAGALMAASDFAIHFSRTAGESTITITTWLICFYYLYKGLKTRQPLDFVLSGLAAGFTLYGYVSAKLLPVFMVFIAIYILARWGLTGAKRYLPGLLLMALAAGLTFAPNGLYILTQDPEALTMRSQGVAIWSPLNQPTMVTTYGTDNWGVIVAGQLGLTYAAFDVGRERGPFYPTEQPILPVPWAALWVLGTAYMVWRIGDARYGVMAIWLLSGLAGAALTNETPTLQRVAGMVPLLALIPAAFIDRVASGLPPLTMSSRLATARRRVGVRRWVMNGGVALLVLALAGQVLYYYFGPYTAKANWQEFALAGHYVAQLDPDKDVALHYNLPLWNGDPSPTIFMANKVPLRQFGNASEGLPVINNDGKNFHFLFAPPDDPVAKALESYYPGGTKMYLNKTDTPILVVYKLTAEQLDAPRRVTARYGQPSQPLLARKEPRLGTSGNGDDAASLLPEGLVYPIDAEWTGGLVAPVYGLYDFSLSASAGAVLEIDGSPVLTATVGSEMPAERSVVLAKGVHSVRLAGKMQDATGSIDLRWGAGTGALASVPRELLWDGPLGTLLGEAYAGPADRTWFTDEKISSIGLLPTIQRRDGLLVWQSINSTLNAHTSAFSVWRGKVRAPVAGDYIFDADTRSTGISSVWINGGLVGAHPIDGAPPLPAAVPLAVGEHTIEVRFGATQDNAALSLYWQPPSVERRLLTPDVLVAGEGGVWDITERPNASGPDPAAIGVIGKTSVQVAQVVAPGGWLEARGVATLPDGRFVVGDTGNGRLVFYDENGRQYASWGGPTGSPDSFGQLSDVAAKSDGTVAALDADKGDIRLFDAAGKMLTHLPNSQLRLHQSGGIAWGPHDGKLYVADTGGSRVVRFNPDGTEEAVYREGNGKVPALDQPVDVAVAADGTIYAVDLLGRVVRLNGNGIADREWKTGVGIQRGGSHIAMWGNLIAMTNPDSNGVLFVDPEANLVRKLEDKGTRPVELTMPIGISSGPGDSLTFLNSNGGNLTVLQRAP